MRITETGQFSYTSHRLQCNVLQPWLTDIHMDFTWTCTTHLSIVCKAAVGVIFSMTGMQLVLRQHCNGECFFSI